MPWVRLDEGFPEHPKMLAAGGDAGWLHVCALAYCNRNLTDGFVPEHILARLSDRKKPHLLARRLVDAGVWDVDDAGWRIHDYLDYQSSKSKVDEDRAKARERMARNRRSSPEQPDEQSEDVRPNISVRSPYPTRPDPTRSEYISDDDDSADTPSPSSSSVDQIIETTALAIALKDRERPGRGFINGIARNLRKEQTAAVNECLEQGVTIRAAAIRIGADPWFVDKALNGSGSTP